MIRKSLLLLVLIIVISGLLIAQTNNSSPPEDWINLDPVDNKIQGVSSNKAYNTLLKGKPSRKIIVAVIDSGVDIEHEDLQGKIWINEDEIPDNGVDDDKNGYIDDVSGWNFIGGKNGEHVSKDTYELTREFVRLKSKFENVTENKVRKKDKKEYQYWVKVKEDFEENSEKSKQQHQFYLDIYNNTVRFSNLLKSYLDTDHLTLEVVNGIESNDKIIQKAKGIISLILQNVGEDADFEAVAKSLQQAVDHYGDQVNYAYNTEFNPRHIVGDNYDDLYEQYYGNNDVIGPDAGHGTHVAGIIAADRNNDIGVRGIAENVKIMVIRAVPDGDERDKDVANAIRYAVDNGAHIINMSFGKDYSQGKEAVDKAVQYAEQKGVLIVHAAGNDSHNLDETENYPTRKYLSSSNQAANWLEIGASSWGDDENFVGNFSNYGKTTVDFFSPGVQVYSTTPGNNYEYFNGTSMAAPATSGAAAILMSYYPELTAHQVKDLLINSSRKFDNLMVKLPGTEEEIEFSQLSVTGGMVNVYEAVKMAESTKYSNTKK